MLLSPCPIAPTKVAGSMMMVVWPVDCFAVKYKVAIAPVPDTPAAVGPVPNDTVILPGVEILGGTRMSGDGLVPATDRKLEFATARAVALIIAGS